MTQIPLKECLDKWCKKVGGAVHSEINQLHIRYRFILLHRKDLTEEQSNTILDYQLCLKEKRYGTLNISTVSGGNNQRYFISKEDAISTTISNESVLIICIVDAEEQRDVTTVYIPNAFI